MIIVAFHKLRLFIRKETVQESDNMYGHGYGVCVWVSDAIFYRNIRPSSWNIHSIMIFGSFFAVCTLIKVKVKYGERNSGAYIYYSHDGEISSLFDRPEGDQKRRTDKQVFLSKEGLT